MSRYTAMLLKDNTALMAEWDREKNRELGLDPSSLTVGSNKKAWWRCEKGHEWQAIINNRNNGSGCPYCSGRKVIEGETDLATQNPALAAEWNDEKNGDLKPTMVTRSTSRKVWWKCTNGHEWKASIASRNQGNGCPHCAHEQVGERREVPAEVIAKLISEWHPVKNKSISMDDLPPYSKKRVWWKCANGHEWQTSMTNRTRGAGCPYCSGRKVTPGENDLITLNPQLASEWHPTLNGDLTPDQVMPGSRRKVWWKCEKGHEWEASITSRRIAGCPYCSSRLPIQGRTDLASTHPHLLFEWDYRKNIHLSPNMVSAQSNERVWWTCERGHEWQTAISTRTAGHNCPYCSGKKLLTGFNDLATLAPDLATEWNYEKNGDLTPSTVMRSSTQEVWWKCANGHEWRTQIRSRKSGSRCPHCAGRRVQEGFNDLTTTHPELAAEWHPKKNGTLHPTMVSYGSGIRVWWKCANGHEWENTVNHRVSSQTVCPYCKREERRKAREAAKKNAKKSSKKSKKES